MSDPRADAITELSNDYPVDAINAYVELEGDEYLDADTLREQFEEAYQGEYSSLADYARECVDEGQFGPVPDALQYYIDYDAIARDFEASGEYSLEDGYVFRTI